MTLVPAFNVDLTTLAAAYNDLRVSVTELERSRWWKALIVLGQRHAAGLLPEWSDVTLPRPQPQRFDPRAHGTEALDAVFGQPAEAILRRDRPDGTWVRLGKPEHVIVDPVSGQDRDSVMVAARERGPWRRIKVPLDDRCLAFNPPSASCKCGDSREYNPISNDFGQQQGLACCFPAQQLAALPSASARALLQAPRRQCPHRQATFICNVNHHACASKGTDSETGHHSQGTGGPKALLQDAPPPGAKTTRGTTKSVLAPGWVDMLAHDASGGEPQLLPSVHDLCAIVGWASSGPDAATAPTIRVYLTRLHRLIGTSVAIAGLRQ